MNFSAPELRYAAAALNIAIAAPVAAARRVHAYFSGAQWKVDE